MSELAWIRSHVERLLEDEWGICRVVADSDGDYLYRVGTAACWVSIMDTDPVMVRVFAHAATGLRRSLKLLSELNDIERRALSVSLVFEHGNVVVAQTVSPWGLSRPVIAQALRAVGAVADDIGLLLAGVFGGATPFPVEPRSRSEDAT